MNEKGLMEQSNAAIKAALELYAADHGKLNDGDSFTTKLNNCVLSMEGSLGHIHTLADVENTIDYLAKEEPEAAGGVEKFSIFDTSWARKIQAAFPQAFVNMQNELIFSLRSNSCFRLEDVSDETQLKAKILEWLTRTAIKGISPKERKLHFEGINKLLGTNFTLEEMTDIYTYLGNGIKHDLCVKFVESGYDMTIIQKEG